MNKNLKLSFILFIIASAIVVAWRTLSKFFGGVGLNFVALLLIVAILIGLIVSDKYVFKRTKELFIACCSLTALELIVYFAVEFSRYQAMCVGLLIYQNILSILGIILLVYTMFRFITEYKEIKIGFIEFILGNGKVVKQQKKAKELTNGTLEDKPNRNRDFEENSNNYAETSINENNSNESKPELNNDEL